MNSQLIFYYSIGIVTVVAAAAVAYLVSATYKKSISAWILYVLIGLSAYIFIAQYLKLQGLHMYADLSHWVQIVKNISATWIPESLNAEFIFPGTRNFFSIHFTPFIYLFALAFRMFPFPGTLLVLQAIVMFSASIPLYLLARKMRGNGLFALLIVTVFFWYPTFQYITLYEFEMLRFSIPLLLWTLYFWEQKRLRLYFLLVVLSILVREEVGLTVFMFGAYVYLIEKRRTLGFITSVLGAGSSLVLLSVVIPYFNDTESILYLPLSWFSGFGDTPFEIVRTIVTQPGLFFTTVFHPIKLANIGMLFIPLLLIPIMSPLVLMSVLANVGTGFMSGAPEHTSYMLYYISPSVPFIFYALLKAWPKIIARCNEHAVMSALLAGVIVSNVFFGPSPISLQFWFKDLRPAPFRTQNFHWSAYQVTQHHARADQFVRLIPDDAIISTEQFLTTKLFTKRGTMVFPQLESADGRYVADYVFIDKENPIKTGIISVPGSWDGLRQNPQFYYDWVEKDPLRWELVKAEDGYFLYHRK